MKTLSDFYRLFPAHPAMLGRTVQATTPNAAPSPVATARPANDDSRDTVAEIAPRYRTRDFGTGYGRSSGYAQDRTYTAGFGDRMLRVG